jgi:hypothetical protein
MYFNICTGLRFGLEVMDLTVAGSVNYNAVVVIVCVISDPNRNVNILECMITTVQSGYEKAGYKKIRI